MDAAQIIKEYWGYAATAVPGLFALWKVWRDGRKTMRKERVDLIQIAEEAAGRAIERLQEESDSLRKRVETLEGEIQALQQERLTMLQTHASGMAEKDATIALLRGQQRQMAGQLASYDKLLTAHGIEHPKPGSPYWQIDEAGELVSLKEMDA